MHAKYSLNEYFFKVDPKQSDSWAWKGIPRNRHQFREGIQWKVGDETKVNFCLGSWCANTNLALMLEITVLLIHLF